MARARNIKPSFFTNEQLGDCEPLARLLYAGLWTVVDREGRTELRPLRWKVELLPFDDCNIVALLAQLEGHSLIRTYAVKGKKYLEVPTFLKHQHPHIKEPKSTVPAPGRPSAKLVRAPSRVEQNPAESLLLNPSSGIPHPESGILNPSSLPSDEPAARGVHESRSKITHSQAEAIYQTYPRHVGKGSAVKAIVSAVKRLAESGNDDPIAFLQDRAMVYAASRSGQAPPHGCEDYRPHPTTWFNSERYFDDESEWSKPNGSSNSNHRHAEAAGRRSDLAARMYKPSVGDVPIVDVGG